MWPSCKVNFRRWRLVTFHALLWLHTPYSTHPFCMWDWVTYKKRVYFRSNSFTNHLIQHTNPFLIKILRFFYSTVLLRAQFFFRLKTEKDFLYFISWHCSHSSSGHFCQTFWIAHNEPNESRSFCLLANSKK